MAMGEWGSISRNGVEFAQLCVNLPFPFSFSNHLDCYWLRMVEWSGMDACEFVQQSEATGHWVVFSQQVVCFVVQEDECCESIGSWFQECDEGEMDGVEWSE